MRRIKVDRNTPDSFRRAIILFVQKYGDGHITKKAIHWIKRTPFSEFNFSNGDLLHAYIDGKKIIGIMAISNYGLEQSIIVVAPKARKKGIAYDLTMGALEELDRLYVKIANDNIPSLKLFFSVGMAAFDLTTGPTGKPTFILGVGNWSKEEWKIHHRKSEGK